MTRRVILIRHAKSSWGDPFADDHERVLNARGRASADAVGKWLAGKGYVPDTVICSDAARTRETAELILPHLSPAPRLQLSSRLYHASPDTIWESIQKHNAEVVAIIGHNPGIGILANTLVAEPPTHPRFQDYPTCATTVIDLPEAGPDTKGSCVDFVVPRDLIGTSGPKIA